MSYADYAITDNQMAVAKLLDDGIENGAEIARQLDRDPAHVRRDIRKLKARAANKDRREHMETTPEGFGIKRTSTYYQKTESEPAQWVIRNQDAEQQAEIFKQFISTYLEDITPLPPIKHRKPKKQTIEYSDVIPWFNIGDGHLNMMAHFSEVGHDFNLPIAERELTRALQEAIEQAPLTERCVIQDMGDMTHYETNDAVTMGHGHSMDHHMTYADMIDVYARTMRNIIDMALGKFEKVDLIVNQGNHSRSNDQWMATFARHVYENNKRLTVVDNKNVFIPYRMGNTFVMCHHSDKCKPDKLADVMSTDYRQDFGEAAYKYIDIGHVHHRKAAIEKGDVTIESFNQLAPRDKYAHDGGWRSRSCLHTVLRSKTYGEVGRKRLSAEQVKDMIDNAAPGTNVQIRPVVHTV